MKTAVTVIISLALLLACLAGDAKTHLFVLSGQSNMHGMDASASFVPALVQAFGEGHVIVAKVAKRGAPLMAWDKDYKWPKNRPVPQGRKKPGGKDQNRDEFGRNFGELYDKLVVSIRRNTDGRKFDTVTLVWMQGETDAGKDLVDSYEAAFLRVLNRLKADLGVESINVVIGRLSDYGTEDKWARMRQLQVQMAEKNPNWAWVDTDDLNDAKMADGSVKNALHYTGEGYKILGQRFAEKAIALLKKL